MTNKRNSDAGAPARTVLVVEADGASAEELRAELERRGFVVSVRRDGTAEAAASERKSSPSSSEDDGYENPSLSEESVGILLRNLTPLELKALSILLRNAGTTIPRRTLYRRLYGGPGPRESRAVDQLLLRLKDKLGRLGESIETRRGVGVLWNPDPKSTSGFSSRRLLEILRARRAAVLSLLFVAALAAGWLLRSGRDGEPGAKPVPAASELPLPPPPVQALPWGVDQHALPGHGPECAIDGDTNTWYQSAGPARKKDGLVVEYHPLVRGTLSVRCGVPGSTNALPRIRVGVSSNDGSGIRKLGEVDPATGLFSGDIGEKPALRVFLIVAADSDEPLAVRSVTVEP